MVEAEVQMASEASQKWFVVDALDQMDAVACLIQELSASQLHYGTDMRD